MKIFFHDIIFSNENINIFFHDIIFHEFHFFMNIIFHKQLSIDIISMESLYYARKALLFIQILAIFNRKFLSITTYSVFLLKYFLPILY